MMERRVRERGEGGERERQDRKRKRERATLEGVILLDLMMDRGSLSQGMQVVVRSWKKQGKESP